MISLYYSLIDPCFIKCELVSLFFFLVGNYENEYAAFILSFQSVISFSSSEFRLSFLRRVFSFLFLLI